MLKVLLISSLLLAASTLVAAQAIPPKTPVKIIRVSEGVSSGRLKSKVEPIYPEEARKKRIQGKVVLGIRVDKQGNVSDVRFSSGAAELTDAAIAAVKQWKYEPIALNGEIIEMESRVTVEFQLKKK
jgi:protein TonB